MSAMIIRIFGENQTKEIHLKLEDAGGRGGVNLVVVDSMGDPIIYGKIAQITPEGTMKVYPGLNPSTKLQIAKTHSGIFVEY